MTYGIKITLDQSAGSSVFREISVGDTLASLVLSLLLLLLLLSLLFYVSGTSG